MLSINKYYIPNEFAQWQRHAIVENLVNTLLISSLCHVNDPQRTQRTHQCGTLASTVTLQWRHNCGCYPINLKNYSVKNKS